MTVEIERLQQAKPSFAERHPALEEVLRRGQFPEGIAIIPDGNRRWAKDRGLEPWEGHAMGLQNMINITKEYSDSPARRLFLWGSSVDNLAKRSEDEVSHLNEYIAMGLNQNAKELIEDNTRLIHVGNKEVLGNTLAGLIRDIEDASAGNDGQTIYLALGYDEVDHDRRSRMKEAKFVANLIKENPNTDLDKVLTDEVLNSFSDASGNWKNMDLLIRTTSPKRSWVISETDVQTFHLSGIGDVVGAKTIITVIPQYFPDLSVRDFDSAVLAFSKSERRQGK